MDSMYLSHTIVCPGANHRAWHTQGPKSGCVQTGSIWGLSGFGCFAHAAHSSAAFTLELPLRLLLLLTPQMNPHNQDPDSISCPQPLGLNSKHLSLLVIPQGEDMIPSATVHGIMPPHMLWRDPEAFAGAAGHLNLYLPMTERSDCGGESSGLYPGRGEPKLRGYCSTAPHRCPLPRKHRKGRKTGQSQAGGASSTLWGGVQPIERSPFGAQWPQPPGALAQEATWIFQKQDTFL